MAAFPVSPVSLLVGRVSSWSDRSQQGARRNAMVACTALAARRAEREDVEEFLARRQRRAQTPSTPARSG